MYFIFTCKLSVRFLILLLTQVEVKKVSGTCYGGSRVSGFFSYCTCTIGQNIFCQALIRCDSLSFQKSIHFWLLHLYCPSLFEASTGFIVVRYIAAGRMIVIAKMAHVLRDRLIQFACCRYRRSYSYHLGHFFSTFFWFWLAVYCTYKFFMAFAEMFGTVRGVRLYKRHVILV